MIEELRQLLAVLSQYEQVSFATLATSMVVAIGCGLGIYLVYRFFYRGVVYSENMGILIVMVSGVTAFIILTIGANLVLSLGMVGALSIVRFRAAIKEPLDVGFIYWSIAVGLTAGARLYPVALVGTVAVGLVYIGMTFLRKDKRNFLLILRYSPEGEDTVDGLLKNVRYKLKNKTQTKDFVELTAEVRVKGNDTTLLKPFNEAEAVSSAVLVEYTGDYT